MSAPISDAALDQMFRAARSHYAWQARPVPETLIKAAYELTKMGPTSANASPARFMFLHNPDAKERLRPHLMESNIEKTISAPWVAIIATDKKYPDKLDQLFPIMPGAAAMFDGMPPALRAEHGLRNSTLQGAYFMLACRALGLDCGPISGFDPAGIDAEFFAGNPGTENWTANFICSVGYGDGETLAPRLPRLSFEEACRIL
jgi:3-hydroxypropanoate dehydrogenase